MELKMVKPQQFVGKEPKDVVIKRQPPVATCDESYQKINKYSFRQSFKVLVSHYKKDTRSASAS